MSRGKKYVVIIGGTGGIGSSIVDFAIKSGFVVVATGTTEAGLKKIRKKFDNSNLITYKLDLQKTYSYEHFFQFIRNNFGNIEWIIHSAGYIKKNEFELKHNQKHIRKTFLINTESVISLTYKFLPLITKAGGVIVISSTSALRGNAQYPIYSASKAALNTFSRALSDEMPSKMQASIAICPGATNTSMRKKISSDYATKQSPDVIGQVVSDILIKSKKYKSGDIVTVENNEIRVVPRSKN